MSLLILVVLLAGFVVHGAEILVVGGHTFEYLGVTYNEDGTSTWTYRVGSGTKPSLSHWVLECSKTIDRSNVVDASETFGIGTDPRTDIYGIKFDNGYCDQRDDDDMDDAEHDEDGAPACETRVVSFTLDAWYEVDETRIATKAGQEVEVEGEIPGPSDEQLVGNSAPIAVDDEAQTTENRAVTISVLANDTDPDGDSLNIEFVDDPENGKAQKSGRKKVKYTPDKRFTGTDRFTYAVSDGNGNTAMATVTVTVGTVNSAPNAADDEATTSENESVVIDLLANDADPDSSIDPATLTLTREPGKGSVAIDGRTGMVTYSPDPGTCRLDTFRYTVSDEEGATSNEARVRVSVLCNEAPEAVADVAETDVDTPVIIDVASNDTDVDGSVRANTVSIQREPKHGEAAVDGATGLVTYIPAGGWCGDDSFRYTIEDDDGAISNGVAVDVAVHCNESPIARDDRASTDENTSVGIDVLANDEDIDGSLDGATVDVTSRPAGGTVSIHPRTGLITYTPDPSTCGDDTFTYTVEDSDGATSNVATVTVTVLCNDPPLAIDDLFTVDEGGVLEIDPAGVLANDVDTPGSPLTAHPVSSVRHGSLTLNRNGSFVYEHDGSETLDDEFSYIANDGEKDSNVASVSLVILPTNDAPSAEDDRGSTEEDTPITLDVLDNDGDPDGDRLSVDWVGPAEHGTAANNGFDITYRPDPDFHGADSFTYAASDGNGGRASATVTVTIEPVNDPPIAEADTASTREDHSVGILVLRNDSDRDGDRLSIIEVAQPGNGWVDNERTEVTYTPDDDFFGVDTFSYTVFDERGGTATATVTVTVEAVNDPPTALDDEDATDEETPVTIDVLSNDEDPEEDPLSIESVARPGDGTADHDGRTVTYTPDPDFFGVDSFTYTVSDGNGGTATALVTVRVASVNDPPVAHEDSETTDEDTPITIDVAANDSDPEHDTLTVESLGRPTAGTVESRGSFVTYVPDRDFHGSDSFSYTVSDGNGGTDTAVVSITVLPVNDPPVAAADETATDEDTPVTARVLENDSDLDGDPLSIRSVTQPADGSVVFDDERVTYTPDSNYHGSDSFSYTVSDGNGGTDTATVTITVASINDGPIAQDDSGTTDEDVSVTLDLLINDDDPDDDPLSIQSTGRPNHGTILAAGTADHDGRTVTYTPDPDFNGSDGFTYTISDGNGGTDTATVTVTVASVNDRPVAENDAAATDEDTSVTIEVLVNDYDEDGDPLNITAVDRPGTGTATVRGESVLYAPNPGFHGADSFTYTVSDGNGGSATASVAITVASVNDLPVAQDDDAVTDEDSLVTVDVLSNDHDPDGDFLLVESVGTPANGSVINADTSISYIPNPGFNGVDTFVYTVTDSNGGSDTANVTVAVAAVNDAPVAQDDSGATDEEVPVTIAVLGNDTDPDGDSLRISAVGQPSHGSASQDGTAVVYTPEPDFAGIDAFTYAISDGSGGTGSATVTVAVAGVNDAPLAGNDRGETEEDESLTLAVLVNDSDPDGDPIAIQSVTQPAHGSVSHDGTQIAYTPDPDAYGTATFSYTISDGNGGLATATVTVDVAPINDAPVARDDQGTTFEDTPNTLAVLANDSDADGDPLAVRSVTAPSHGTTETDGANVTYVPDANFHGTDSFWYTIDDGRGATATADVTITVTSTNDLPIASDDEETTDEDVPAAIDVLANDADPDGDALAVLSVTQPANGSVRNDGTDVTYTPDPNFQGTDSFSYTISDGNGGTDAASVTIRVVPVNDVPVAQSDFEATEEDTPVTVAVLANDTDPDGDPLSILSVTQPADGSVTVAGGTVTYTPSADYHGTDRFSYTIGDGQGGTSTAEVRIAVAVVNDVPVAIDDEGSTSEDTELVLRVLANDSDPDGDPLSISAVAQPANGTVTHDGSRVTYAPNPDFHGSDSFRYTASDGNGGTASATVTVSVSSVNDAPIAQDDSGATEEDVSVSIAVLGNDSDPDGDALSLSPTTQPANGTVITEGGAVRYTPDPDVHGTDSFTYTISDPDGATATATVTVTVAAINDVPNATDDAASTNEDVRVSIPVLDNDIDPDGDALSLAGVSQPLHGSVAVEGREAIYAPDPDFHGTDTFTYSVSDGGGESDTAIVTVTVTPVNDAPLAQDDSAATAEDVGVSIPALDNDADPDGDPLAITQLTQPANGTASHDGRTVTYMPNAEFHGTDSFTYTVSDGNGGATTATISVAVAVVNDPPIAVDDTRTTNEDTAVTIPVLNNDTDPDGDSIVVQSITQPANGIVVNGGGSVTYTPDPDFNGSDDFAYTISDGNGGTDTANVVVTVSPVNDPPVAQNDSATIAEDTAFEIDVLGNDVDPEDDRLLVSTVNQPAEGSVINHGDRISYSPSPGFHGTVSFGYTVSDGNGGSATATVTIVVTPVNDVPVAQDDSGSTQEDVPVTLGILANDIDPDGDVLTIQSVTQPGRGTVVSSGSDTTYTPEPGFFGTDSFQYTVSDGAGGTDQATVTVTVTAVNDAPAAKDDSGTTEEEVAITIDVLANDSDPDGDTLTVQSVTQPANGTVAILDGRLTYTPAPGFHGIDTFTYTASDGNGGTGTATVTIAVAMVNDPPIARNDSRATVENQPVDIAVLANDDDPDGDPLSIQSVTQPANGSAVSDGTSVTYTPNPGFAGTDTFTYVVSDGSGGIDQAVVTLTVSTVNDPPIAQDDRASTVEGRPVSIAVTANDNDPDGDALTVESATQPAHGAVVPSGSTVMYTPSPGFHGTDTFSYTVSDGRGGTDSASVTVTIDPLNDPPAAQDDAGTTSEDSPLTVMILANDSDPDGDPLIVESLTQPAGGTAVNNGDSVTYIPGTGFSGTDTFTYTVSDGRGETDTATVIISVTARNNPPVAQDDSAATEEGVLVSIPVLENDVDPDGDFLLVEAFTQPANGSVLNARTGVSYIPDAGFQGIDTFEYSVSDGNGGTATATVTVSVAGVNALPVAQDDNDLTDEDVPVTILVLDNDSDPDGDVLRVESVEQPENGAVANNGIDVTYTPAPGFSGVDEFRYTVSDGVGGTATAAVFVAISPANDPPAAQNDSTTTNRDLPVALPVLDNDSDPDDDRLTVSSVTQPAHGSAATDGATVVYTPNEGFTGSDTFTYTVSDGHGGTDVATVTIGVSGEAGAGGAEEGTPCAGKVIISEVAWAGTAADPKDEWIELRNLGTTSVSLDGWELRWRRGHPNTPEEQVWKIVELSGELRPSSGRACDDDRLPTEPVTRFSKESPDDPAWLLESEIETDTGFFVLERRHENTLSDTKADLVYDTVRTLNLELSDHGEVLMLVNAFGEVVDTANAANLGRDGWVAGSASTYGSMERLDPLAADTAGNWHTNEGIVTHGADANGHLLRGTPGGLNSPAFERLERYAEIEPMSVRAGELLHVDFLLPRQDRRTTGWPWISVSRPGFVGAAGAGGTTNLAGYSFSGRYDGTDRYVLDIGTQNLPPGTYVFWITYGQGRAALVPIVVAR